MTSSILCLSRSFGLKDYVGGHVLAIVLQSGEGVAPCQFTPFRITGECDKVIQQTGSFIVISRQKEKDKTLG